MEVKVKINKVQEYLDKYHKLYRNTNLKLFSLSEIYDLFPLKNNKPREMASKAWPDYWPNADKRGVYLILDIDLSVIYIGKASMNNDLGSRLSDYFMYKNRGKGPCKIIKEESWDIRPEFICTIPVDDDKSFEAPALEEYLIKVINPPENSNGKVRDI